MIYKLIKYIRTRLNITKCKTCSRRILRDPQYNICRFCYDDMYNHTKPDVYEEFIINTTPKKNIYQKYYNKIFKSKKNNKIHCDNSCTKSYLESNEKSCYHQTISKKS